MYQYKPIGKPTVQRRVFPSDGGKFFLFKKTVFGTRVLYISYAMNRT